MIKTLIRRIIRDGGGPQGFRVPRETSGISSCNLSQGDVMDVAKGQQTWILDYWIVIERG